MAPEFSYTLLLTGNLEDFMILLVENHHDLMIVIIRIHPHLRSEFLLS